jgi:hypothetical protein
MAGGTTNRSALHLCEGRERRLTRLGSNDDAKAKRRRYTIDPDGDTINLYYGGADSCIALATGSIRGLLEWLEQNSL